jgi:hypothetical protein
MNWYSGWNFRPAETVRRNVVAAFMGKVFAYAPAALQAEKGQTPANDQDVRSDFTAKPVQGPVNMADLRRKVMARHPVVRAYLAR